MWWSEHRLDKTRHSQRCYQVGWYKRIYIMWNYMRWDNKIDPDEIRSSMNRQGDRKSGEVRPCGTVRLESTGRTRYKRQIGWDSIDDTKWNVIRCKEMRRSGTDQMNHDQMERFGKIWDKDEFRQNRMKWSDIKCDEIRLDEMI